jgi:histidinol-phosphatase (PHP family)
MGFSANLHTHTYRCGHAIGEAVEYADAAARHGLRILGFSDHAPLPDGRWSDMRMRMDQLDGYVAAVQAARRAHPGLRILLGLECEFLPAYAAFYADEILGRRRFDYLIAGCHYTPIDGGWIPSFDGIDTPARLRAYADYAIATMASGLFAFLTHPDLIGCSNPRWTTDTAACARDICQASVALQVPLEINSYGVRKPWIAGQDGPRPAYPWNPFWQVAGDCGVQVVLSSDAHRPQDIDAGYAAVAGLRDRYGLREARLPGILEPRSGGHAAGG